MIPFNADKEINDVDDFNSYVEEQFTCFLQELIKDESMTRPVEEDDGGEAEECASFMYTNKAIKIIERYRDRMLRIGEAHFPNQLIDIEVSSYMYLEF